MFRFWNKNPEGADREGHTRGGLQRSKTDGFTMGTTVHNYGPEIDNTATLRYMEPYQAR
jgi:protein phosphatase 1 regulatory subunit 32